MLPADSSKTILVTGAAGKVGQAFIRRLLDDPQFKNFKVRALCHHRTLETHARLEVVRGSIEHREVASEAVSGVTHVLHLATCKEIPETVMDVTVKGLFWLLEACRVSEHFQQFILIGGDAGMGHFFYPHPRPVTETQRHSAYPADARSAPTASEQPAPPEPVFPTNEHLTTTATTSTSLAIVANPSEFTRGR